MATVGVKGLIKLNEGTQGEGEVIKPVS